MAIKRSSIFRFFKNIDIDDLNVKFVDLMHDLTARGLPKRVNLAMPFARRC